MNSIFHSYKVGTECLFEIFDELGNKFYSFSSVNHILKGLLVYFILFYLIKAFYMNYFNEDIAQWRSFSSRGKNINFIHWICLSYVFSSVSLNMMIWHALSWFHVKSLGCISHLLEKRRRKLWIILPVNRYLTI